MKLNVYSRQSNDYVECLKTENEVKTPLHVLRLQINIQAEASLGSAFMQPQPQIQ